MADYRAETVSEHKIKKTDDQDGLTRARHVIDDHLKRFAFREDFAGMDWQTA